MSKVFLILINTILYIFIFPHENHNFKIQCIDAYHPLFQNEPQLKAADFVGKLDELLTLELAAKISGFDASKATKEHDNKTSTVFGGDKKPPRECSYLWDNGRIHKINVGGKAINGSYKDKVILHSVANTTLERFKRNYGVLTNEQKEIASKNLEEESKRKPSSSSSQKVTQVGISMVINLKTEEISNIGEAATWYENTNELKVFFKGLMFSVVVDISDDKTVNRKKSIELAEAILKTKLSQKKK